MIPVCDIAVSDDEGVVEEFKARAGLEYACEEHE